MAPNAETNDILTMTSEFSKVHSLKAAIFHTMAFKLSLEIHKNKITPKCLIAFLKVLYNVTQIKKKKITFEQYSRIHLQGPKIAICETASNVVFVLNSSFTSKDQYFRAAIQEATDAFNNMLQEFGYTQQLELYDPMQPSTSSSIAKLSLSIISNTKFYLLLFHSLTTFRLQTLHLLSMMLRNVVDDYFQELLHMLKLFTSPTHDGQQHPSPLWVHRRCQKLSSSSVSTLQMLTS